MIIRDIRRRDLRQPSIRPLPADREPLDIGHAVGLALTFLAVAYFGAQAARALWFCG